MAGKLLFHACVGIGSKVYFVRCGVAACLLFWAVCPIRSYAADRPVNDNFADRIVLAGNSNEFTAVLDGSTEEYYNGHWEMEGPRSALGTVWFSWTATEALPVVLEIVEVSQISQAAYNGTPINVWSLTNLDNFPTIDFFVSPIVTMLYATGTRGSWTTFMAEPGRSYELQVGGGTLADLGTDIAIGRKYGAVKLRLVAQSKPLITESPLSQTVRLGGSAMFVVFAAGVLPFSYHWYHDGNELSTTNAPMFGLDSVSPEMAGSYFAVVSNIYGCSTSGVATLQVANPPIRPSLSFAAASSNRFEFVLNGDSNAFYGIEYTTNGSNWEPTAEFPRGLRLRTSVVRTSGSSVLVSMTNDNSAIKLFRAATYIPVDEICNNNLRRLHFAKRIYARQYGKLREDVPPQALDLNVYFDKPVYGQCPAGGQNYPWFIGACPICTVTNHVFEEVWPQ